MSRLFIFPSFLTFSAPGCQIFQWNRMFPPFQLPVDNHSVSFTDAIFFLWAPSRLCRDIGSLSYFLLIILSPPVAPAMSPNESSHRLTCFFMGTVPWTCLVWVCDKRWWIGSTVGVKKSRKDTPHLSSQIVTPSLWTTAGSGFGISQSSRLSSSVSAMRVLNTGSDVEEALADALVWKSFPTTSH